MGIAAGGGVLSLETSVSELPLTAMERNSLGAIGILTLREFLDLDVRRVLNVRYRGVGTYNRLKASQKALRKKCLPDEEGIDETASFLRQSVAELELSLRGLHALERLHVDTVADFLKHDLRKPPLIRNCGSVTHRELAALQESLRQRLGSDVCLSLVARDRPEVPGESRLDAARSQMTPSSLRWLPLFSGEPLSGILAGELHASYRPGTPVSDLRLGTQRGEVLSAAGVRLLGELLLTPHGQLTGPHKLTRKRLIWLRSLVKEFLCEPAEHATREVDASTPERFLASLVAPVLTDARQRRVFLERISWGGLRRTLASLGQEYGVTRERIRQIERIAHRKLTHWRARTALAPVHDFIRSLRSAHSRPLSLVFICRSFQEKHKWPRPLSVAALRKLLPAFPDLKLVGEEYVVII